MVFAALFAPHAGRSQLASTMESEPRPWLRWLGPLAPRPGTLPVVPSPLKNPAQVWTIDQALSRALQANPDVQVALVNVQRQDGLRLQSVSLLLPRLGVSASTDWRAKGLIDRSKEELAGLTAPIPRALTIIDTHGYNVQAEIRQTLFDGLASWHSVRRAAMLQKKASLDARDLYLRVASQVRQAYDNVLLRQKVVATRTDAVRDLTHLAEVAQKRFGAGLISDFESQRARSAQRSAEADLAQAQSDLARAQELFCRYLYIDKPAEGLQLTGDMVPLEYGETFAAALSKAQANRLDLRSAQLQLDASRMSQRIAAASLLPRIEGFVDYAYRGSYYDVNRQIEGWMAGITARWDIFDSGQTLGQIRVQRAERRAAEIRFAEIQRLIPSQVRELFAALEQSSTVMAAHVSARDLAERNVRDANRLYEAGSITLEQVLNAELTYRQALLGWLSAVYTYNATVYQLDYVTADESFLDRVTQSRR
jgi:outer membrane protein TolC